MDSIHLLKAYPININKTNFGIQDQVVESELFNAVWIQKENYNQEAVKMLCEMWQVPESYLVGRLRCEAALKLILIEKNMAEGLYYYKLAANENKSVEALFSLANMKLTMTQTLQSHKEAFEHLQIAVTQPQTIEYGEEVYTNKFIVESQLMYANLCFEGVGGPKNLEEAKKYYEMALEYSKNKGAPFAKYAIILCRGDGGDVIPKDLERGLSILKGIIDQDGEDTQPGIIFLYGKFLFSIKPEEAIEFIRKAAKNNYPTAKDELETFESNLKKLKSDNSNNNNNNNNNNKKGKNNKVKKNNLC
ncbi:hypothetical protein DICPUDRAFT_37781 [Dictyostelium purpureum]|uniref:Uncharacterized protein n=1 Tax=Dictyostelium purpureum TaxID=5786 RepID=F0ZTD8_DICPU|nr:uncharacterized protein DICPUDRAFT_37781 [Dictyostelium purpureum]EGC32791.1 hypothetical protein DICPUDRAFT_37781 [Dictyostelium purpureum]|eukprot:XP_003290679.1 hypothetical protein DICPUDRAFT_37781 [Dictyostelium purpureum]